MKIKHMYDNFYAEDNTELDLEAFENFLNKKNLLTE